MYFLNGKLRLAKGPTFQTKEVESAKSKSEFEIDNL